MAQSRALLRWKSGSMSTEKFLCKPTYHKDFKSVKNLEKIYEY